jgi:hypothetical protein
MNLKWQVKFQPSTSATYNTAQQYQMSNLIIALQLIVRKTLVKNGCFW